MIKILAGILDALLALIVLSIPLFLFLNWPRPASTDSLQVFNHGSIGNQTTQGLPYWIWRVLPSMFPEYLPGNQDGWGSIGFYWIGGEELPVGFSKTKLGPVSLVAPNCAFCHQGSYRLHANDVSTFVAAGAGTQVNVQGYIRFLIAVGRAPDRFTADKVMAAIEAIYKMPLWERLLYRYALIPAVRSALAEQVTRFAWMDSRPDCPRPDWGPGRIDPFNPVKFYNLHLPDDCTIGNSDIVPLWDLNRLTDGARVYSFHWDGLNTDLRESAIAGAIGDGMTYRGYSGAQANLNAILDFIRLQKPPPSPFSADRSADDPYHVDAADVEKGRALYQANCAVCHDPDGARFRTVISVTELGTDRHRIDMWTEAAKERYSNYEQGGHSWGFHAFHKTNGYVADELTGLWLRGPYLHNGSVPTLRDLLAPPSARPKKFYRGYDLIDSTNGGYVSQPGTPAERYGTLYDTASPGNDNSGHLYGTALSDQDKQRLLAFLKTL